jgi:hypothetical protein
MTWYAEVAGLRRRQVAVDVAVALWVLLWLRVGFAVHDGVQRLAGPGAELVDAGQGLSDALDGAADGLGRVPGIGGGLRSPLDAAADAGDLLSRAGAAQQDAVGTFALLLALVLAGLPVAAVVWRWSSKRLRWARDATAADRLRGDVDLLALRAATSAPLPELAALGPDVVTRWRRGDEASGRALAQLELRRLGLLPAPPEAPGQAPSRTR